jgi:ribulose-5-phosphate 4-epimerase/fuculose-1-phosphate aldolase
MDRTYIETQLLEACRRLAGKGFFNAPANGFSLRVPGTMEMILATGVEDWSQIAIAHLQTASLLAQEGSSGLHASIYQERPDVGAIAISSPKGARLLARHGGRLPPLFDELVRHIGSSVGPLPDVEKAHRDLVRKTFRGGANAALLGERLLCLGMTCERVLFNTELYEKCAQCYVIARASGNRIGFIPVWVRLIANRRLLGDERRAAASYRIGQIPEGISAY